MRLSILTLPILALLTAPVRADEPMSKSEAEARASLALAKAKAKMPALAAQTRSIAYKDAVELAKKDKKPIFVSVRLQCASLCKELRPAFITCHEQTLEGSDTPRALLLLPGSDGKMYRVKTWTELPSAMQVRQVHAQFYRTMEEPADPSLDVLMAMFVGGMVAVEPGFDLPPGTAPPGYGYLCDGVNPCRLVPLAGTPSAGSLQAQGYTSLPAFEAYATSGEAFVARFPRLARFRGRVRGAVGLSPPHVAGGFVSYPAPQAPAAQQAAASAPATPMAAAAGDFVQIGNHRVPGQLIDRARKAGLSWGTIFKIILTAGMEALQRILEELGK